MFRTSLIAIATVATVTAAAVSPASAWNCIAGLIDDGGVRWVLSPYGGLVYRPVDFCR